MYLDSDILFALIRPNDRHSAFAVELLDSKEKVYSSVVALIELEIVVKREISDYVSQNILEVIRQKIPRLEILSLSEQSFAKSLVLRKTLGMGIFDSMHAALALSRDARIASTDHIFERVHGLKRVKPKAG